VSKAMGATIESKPASAYDNGLTGLPLAQRPGITLPTPANLQAVADNAAAQRQRETEARNSNPHDLGRSWGVTRDMVLFLQRLEGTVLEQGRTIADLRSEIAQLRSSAQPRHMQGVEMRG
jgi:hypothetical protein